MYQPFFWPYLTIFARIFQMIIATMKFSVLDMMHVISFWNPKFIVGLGFPHFGFLISGGTKRHTFGVYFLYLYFAVKIFLMGCAADTLKLPF